MGSILDSVQVKGTELEGYKSWIKGVIDELFQAEVPSDQADRERWRKHWMEIALPDEEDLRRDLENLKKAIDSHVESVGLANALGDSYKSPQQIEMEEEKVTITGIARRELLDLLTIMQSVNDVREYQEMSALTPDLIEFLKTLAHEDQGIFVEDGEKFAQAYSQWIERNKVAITQKITELKGVHNIFLNTEEEINRFNEYINAEIWMFARDYSLAHFAVQLGQRFESRSANS